MDLSLVEICLNLVVNNFKRYNSLFSTTEDSYIKRLLDFLQRRYSFEILSRLCHKKDLPEEFVNVLVNQHLTFLDTSWFKKCSWEKVTAKVAEIGCNVEKIYLDFGYFGEFYEDTPTPWQDIICHLTNLKSFTFHDDCHDLIVKNVAKFCHNIEEIDIRNSYITSDGIKYLCKNESGKPLCVTLKKLCVGNALITDDDIGYLLKNIPSLEVIDYPALPLVLHSLHKNDLEFIDKVKPYNITTLDLKELTRNPSFADILKICVSVCPRLKCLNCCVVKEEDLNHLFNLNVLEQLHIETYTISNINIDSLLKSVGGKLTSLTIVNCTVSISVLAESCLRLKELLLNKVDFLCDDNSKPLFNLLSSLTFENYVSKNANAIDLLLSSSAKLESFSFRRCILTASELKIPILKCCELFPIKEITFSTSVIEKEFIKEVLCNCPSLKRLNIDACVGSDDGDELTKFGAVLPHKPKIIVTNHLYNSRNETDSDSDSSDSDSDYYNSDDFDFYYDSDYYCGYFSYASDYEE